MLTCVAEGLGGSLRGASMRAGAQATSQAVNDSGRCEARVRTSQILTEPVPRRQLATVSSTSASSAIEYERGPNPVMLPTQADAVHE